MKQQAPYIFHGHDVSYYSGKVRPAFPQKNLWVREVLQVLLYLHRPSPGTCGPGVLQMKAGYTVRVAPHPAATPRAEFSDAKC